MSKAITPFGYIIFLVSASQRNCPEHLWLIFQEQKVSAHLRRSRKTSTKQVSTVYTYMYICVYSCVCIYIYTYVCVYIYIYIICTTTPKTSARALQATAQPARLNVHALRRLSEVLLEWAEHGWSRACRPEDIFRCVCFISFRPCSPTIMCS